MIGTIVAILLLAVGFNGLTLLGVPFRGQPLFNGAVLLVAALAARAEGPLGAGWLRCGSQAPIGANPRRRVDRGPSLKSPTVSRKESR